MLKKKTKPNTKPTTLKRRRKVRRVNEVCDHHKNRITATKPTLCVVPILFAQKNEKKQPNRQEQITYIRPKAPHNLTQTLVKQPNLERKRPFIDDLGKCTEQKEIGNNNSDRVVVGEFGFVIEENSSMENVNFDW
ncbi:hypothetical protein M0813_00769 [Anaeramoeba flamelloides]|uniref:Uncharacterized protein n=1 Tax=Anaeramoeba flamelloides TaxID=1746091 RepID=A0ABQ8XRY1_9EUKA|nr:hypothetical protein M0813_00769 [Anaeramoeba flamelloides]